MFSNEALKGKFNKVSAKTLSLAGSKYMRARNEKTIELQAPFKYDPLATLTSIRLLQLHEGAKTDLISLTLTEHDLNKECPPFEALSYTWLLKSEVHTPASEREERPILVNGKTLHITMSLYYALLQFRAEENVSLLWADQISMNQQDHVEKGCQLAIMHDIYSKASVVRIWLGAWSKTQGARIEALDKIAKVTATDLEDPLQQYKRTNSAMSQSSTASTSSAMAKARKIGASMKDFVQMTVQLVAFEEASSFLANRWFKRAWTLQEFRLAEKAQFYVGDEQVSHESIRTAAQSLLIFHEHSIMLTLAAGEAYEVEVIDRSQVDAILALFDEQSSFEEGRRYTAEEYLRVIRQRHAAVPEDKVFAGSALLKKTVTDPIGYNQTARDVYTEFASERLWDEAGNQALALVGGTASNIDGLPSWVPDLSTALHPEPLRLCGGPVFSSLFTANSGPSKIEGGILHVQFAPWTTVRTTGESSWAWRRYSEHPYGDGSDGGHMRTTSSAVNERFGLLFALLNEIGPVYPVTEERTMDVLWQILICGIKDQSPGSKTLWRDRFYHWFGYVLVALRYQLYMGTKTDFIKTINFVPKRKWMTALIVDRADMEARLQAFLAMHDTDGGLRNAIKACQSKFLGTESDDLADMTAWATAGGLWLQDFDPSFLKPTTEFLHRFKKGYEGRRIFVTDNGYLGCGIEDVRAGDMVGFISGTDSPYILRKVSGKEDIYTLVGEAYVHGIMDGTSLNFNSLSVREIKII